ncbi:MAG: hypothetical protein NT154_14685, partial [Verrucomicrobia bacterium]|nr:hypothetical protein [Verrucomicrobiota bacterium]
GGRSAPFWTFSLAVSFGFHALTTMAPGRFRAHLMATVKLGHIAGGTLVVKPYGNDQTDQS